MSPEFQGCSRKKLVYLSNRVNPRLIKINGTQIRKYVAHLLRYVKPLSFQTKLRNGENGPSNTISQSHFSFALRARRTAFHQPKVKKTTAVIKAAAARPLTIAFDMLSNFILSSGEHNSAFSMRFLHGWIEHKLRSCRRKPLRPYAQIHHNRDNRLWHYNSVQSQVNSGDTILNYSARFGFGPGFWRASVRPKRFSSRATKRGAPSGRPVRSPARIAAWSSAPRPAPRNSAQSGAGIRGTYHSIRCREFKGHII
jgi:hypothetical protein